MTRRNQKNQSGQGKQNKFSKRNQYKRSPDRNLNKMLDLGRLTIFKYEAKAIFNSLGMDDKVWAPMLASIVTKASRQGIKEAKEYIIKQNEEEILSEETAKALSNLLDRFKKWR